MDTAIPGLAVAHVVTLIRTQIPGAAISARLRETADNTPCRAVFGKAGSRLTKQSGAVCRYDLAAGEQALVLTHIQATAWD